MTDRTKGRLALAAAAATLVSIQSASAQTPVNTWDGSAADNLWATPANWSQNAVPIISGGQADDAVFPDGLGALAITIPTGAQAGRLNFFNTATTTLATASGSANMTLRHGILLNPGAGPVSITHPTGTAETINTNGTSQSIINNSSSQLFITSNVGNVNNAGSTLTVDGSGPIVLGGGFSDRMTGANPLPTTHVIKNGTGSIELQAGTFRGNFTMNDGVVRIRSNNALGTVAKTVTYNGGLMSAVVSDRTIPAAVSWVFNSDANVGGLGSSFTIAGLTDLGGVARTFDVGTLGGGLGNIAFTGAISNGGIIKTGPNNLTSGSASTYTGNTVVNGGILQWVNTSDIQAGAIVSGPFGTGTVTMNTGTTLRSNTTATTKFLQNNVVVNGNVTLGGVAPNNFALVFNSTDGTDTLSTPATFTLGTTPTLDVLVPVTIANPVVGTGGFTKTGAETLTLSGATNYTGATNVNVGTVVMTQGLKSGDALTIADSAKMVVPESTPNTYNPPTDYPSGSNATASKVNALTIAATGTLDLGNNDMAIDYVDPNSPLDTVRDLLTSGYNGGGWDGFGIISNTVNVNNANQLDPSIFGLGYAENGALPVPYGNLEAQGGPLFGDQDVDLSTVLVKFTWVGDLNLDGFVDFGDLSVFNTNYDNGATSGRYWFEGDFNYDGVIDFGDLSLFNTNYDPSKPSLPEPGAMSVLAAAAGLGVLRRRRQPRV